MDLIIRLNPSTEHQLIKLQKEFLLSLNSSFGKSVFFPHYPILCFLTNQVFTDKNIPKIKKNITNFSIKNIKIENSELLFTVEIKIENISVEEKILAGFTEIKTESKILDELNIKCRSFQIAELKKTGFTYEIWTPVWCKLK